jgi:hypothetical protein
MALVGETSLKDESAQMIEETGPPDIPPPPKASDILTIDKIFSGHKELGCDKIIFFPSGSMNASKLICFLDFDPPHAIVCPKQAGQQGQVIKYKGIDEIPTDLVDVYYRLMPAIMTRVRAELNQHANPAGIEMSDATPLVLITDETPFCHWIVSPCPDGDAVHNSNELNFDLRPEKFDEEALGAQIRTLVHREMTYSPPSPRVARSLSPRSVSPCLEVYQSGGMPSPPPSKLMSIFGSCCSLDSGCVAIEAGEEEDEWEEWFDTNGHRYYFNSATQESVWEKPGDKPPAAIAANEEKVEEGSTLERQLQEAAADNKRMERRVRELESQLARQAVEDERRERRGRRERGQPYV